MKKIKPSLSLKLICAFFTVSFLVLVAGLVGIGLISKITSLSETVFQEKIPITTASNKAAVSLNKIISSIQKYQTAYIDTEPLKQDIIASETDFKMWEAAIRLGTESEEFQNSDMGRKYKNEKHTLIIPKANEEILQKLAQVNQNFIQTSEKITKLIDSHTRLTTFYFQLEGITYRIDQFCFEVISDIKSWIDYCNSITMQDSIFEKNTDPAQSFFSRGYKLFLATDEKLTKLYKKANKYNAKMHSFAAKINTVDIAGQDSSAPKKKLATRAKSQSIRLQRTLDQTAAYIKPQVDALMLSEAALFGEMVKDTRIIENLLEELNALAGADMQRSMDKAQKAKSDAYIFLTTVMILANIAACLLGLILSKSLTSSIGSIIFILKKIAKGDLSHNAQIKTKDEVGLMGKTLNATLAQLRKRAELAGIIAKGDLRVDVEIASKKDNLGVAFDDMVEHLNDMVQNITEAASNVSISSSQVSQASQKLSQGATEQAASLEEVTSAMGEMENRTNANAKDAKHAKELAETAARKSLSGKEQMQQMNEYMQQINNNAKETQKVIKTIDDIAFQTNLLALNAAVESARAGIHGKGFAVVAEEVRNLAAKSAKAAAETSDLINLSNKEIQEGVEISQKTSDALTEISENVKETDLLIGNIAQSSDEQAEGIAQVHHGLTQIDNIAQENTASAEETASSSEEMSAQATALQNFVSRFKLKHQNEVEAHSLVSFDSGNEPETEEKEYSA